MTLLRNTLKTPRPSSTLLVLLASMALCAVDGNAAEFRGLWADAFHAGFFNDAEVTNLIANARAANLNAVIAEVRKRGDAYYDSRYEPKALGVETNFDPLADLILKGHDTNIGPAIELHAWLTAYPVWRGADGSPSQTNHPYLLHPDWLTRNFRGGTYDGKDYVFDPGHPEVQKHVFNVAMEVVSHYDIDGLNLDYMHYSGRDWGYNPAVVNRFNQRFRRTGQPNPNDPVWSQFRRDQVTDLMRKIYLCAIDLKPHLKISAATITWPPSPNDDTQWIARSAGYTHVFQDWRAWMEEGILDMNIPMLYVPTRKTDYAAMYTNWVKFAVSHSYGRQVVISPAIYLNPIRDSLLEIHGALSTSVGGQRADGVCLYSYASYCSDNEPRERLTEVLTRSGDPSRKLPPAFPEPVATPGMPWKVSPTKGHLKGFVYGGNPTNTLDGATITIQGPANRKLSSDATGFYGAVNIPLGNYSVTVTFPGFATTESTCSVTAGKVATVEMSLLPAK